LTNKFTYVIIKEGRKKIVEKLLIIPGLCLLVIVYLIIARLRKEKKGLTKELGGRKLKEVVRENREKYIH
jgi:hypothetical protein